MTKPVLFLFAGQGSQCFRGERGRHENFDKLLLNQCPCAGTVHRLVKGNDSAKSGNRIGCKGTLISFQAIACHSDAAGVGVLDDHTGRAIELVNAGPGSIGISDVVE